MQPVSTPRATRTPRPAALMEDFSMEVTLPAVSELDALREILPGSTRIFVSAPPNHAAARLAKAAIDVRRAGFEPVPHVAARSFTSAAQLDDFIGRLTNEAGVRRVLVLGGDLDTPAGPFADANAVIESDVLSQHGIRAVGIAGYPDGHPKIPNDRLLQVLRMKIASAQARGLAVEIVSQFCFEADRIAAWAVSLRELAVTVPVRFGIAGPTSMKGLMRFALRCGVRGSVKALMDGKARSMVGEATSDEVIVGLAGTPLPDRCAVHVFSFGGIVNTARWTISFAPPSRAEDEQSYGSFSHLPMV